MTKYQKLIFREILKLMQITATYSNVTSGKKILSRKGFTAIASIFYPVGMTEFQN